MVPQGGFEPPTNGLGNRYSIQLSYWGTLSAAGRSSPRELCYTFAGIPFKFTDSKST